MKSPALTIVVYVACVGVAGIPRAAAGQQGGAAPRAPYRVVAEVVLPSVTPPEITIQDTPGGPILADTKGFSLYVTNRDKEPGKATCYGPCAEQWVPVRAQADTKPSGDFSLVPRDDGRPQWAYKGRPLYRYAPEANPRWPEANNEFWQYASLTVFPAIGSEGGRRGYRGAIDAKIVLPASPGGITGQPSREGVVFADSKGMTLYSPKAGVVCNGACLDSWLPLTAGQAASPVVGDWTIVARNDGIKQWAYEGRPVYRSVKDLKPTDISGANDEWSLVLVPAPGSAPAKARAPKPAAK